MDAEDFLAGAESAPATQSPPAAQRPPAAQPPAAAAPPPSAKDFLLSGSHTAAFLEGRAPARQGFWADFGQATGGIKGLLEAPFTQSMPAEAAKWAWRNRGEILASPPMGGIPVLDGIAQTAAHELDAFLEKPATQPLGTRVREAFAQTASLARQHPGSVAGSLLKGLVADPELFFLPELSGAKSLETAGRLAKAAGLGERATQVAQSGAAITARAGTAAGIGGGAEALREAGEGEDFNPAQVITSAALALPFAATQVPLKLGAKMSPEAVARVLGETPRGESEPEVVPTHEGYAVHANGEPVAKFETREEAEDQAREIERMGSAYRTAGVAPPGSAEAERTRFLHENPFTPEKMAKLIRRPQRSAAMSARDLAQFFAKTGAAAAIGAGLGAYLDREDPETGAIFGAGAAALPRLLPRDRRISIEEAVNERNGFLARWARRTYQFKSAIESEVPEELRRNAISLALEGTPGVELNAREQAIALEVRKAFDAIGETAVDAGVLKELLGNYVTHLVEEDPKAKPSLVETIVNSILGRSERSRPPASGKPFTKHRKYATFEELQAALRGSGLRIRTGDVAEIVAIYSNAMMRTITDKRLLDALKSAPVEDMPPLVLPPARVPGTPPAGARALERAPLEGEAVSAIPRLPNPNGLPTRAGGAAFAGGEGLPGAPRESEGFTLPPPPPEQARRARTRMLIEPVERMDSQYVVMPNRQLAGYAVHKDIAPQLNFIFSARDPNDVTLGLAALNQAAKRSAISFSMFHAKSLADAFIGAIGTRALTSPKRLIERALAQYQEGGSNDGIDALLAEGLRIQVPEERAEATEDARRDALDTAFARVAEVIDRTLPVSGAASTAAHAISRFNGALDQFTFGYLQTGFKLAVGLDAYEGLLVKGVEKRRAARTAASYANDIFGGLDWFRVANDVTSRIGRELAYGFFNPNGRRWMQMLMFAPDWTFSTFRAAYKALPGAVDDPALAALHRRYLVKSAIYYLTIANALNFITAGHSIFENENPTRVQLADGRTMQFSKHFNEPFEWLRDPIQTADNKLGFYPRAAVELGTGKEYISAHDAAPDIESRAATIASMFLPISAQQGLAGGGASSALGLVGMPIYGKTPEQKLEAREEKKAKEREKRKAAEEYLERQLH